MRSNYRSLKYIKECGWFLVNFSSSAGLFLFNPAFNIWKEGMCSFFQLMSLYIRFGLDGPMVTRQLLQLEVKGRKECTGHPC